MRHLLWLRCRKYLVLFQGFLPLAVQDCYSTSPKITVVDLSWKHKSCTTSVPLSKIFTLDLSLTVIFLLCFSQLDCLFSNKSQQLKCHLSSSFSFFSEVVAGHIDPGFYHHIWRWCWVSFDLCHNLNWAQRLGLEVLKLQSLWCGWIAKISSLKCWTSTLPNSHLKRF